MSGKQRLLAERRDAATVNQDRQGASTEREDPDHTVISDFWLSETERITNSMAASHQASGNVFQPPLGTNIESQENNEAHRTLVRVQQ